MKKQSEKRKRDVIEWSERFLSHPKRVFLSIQMRMEIVVSPLHEKRTWENKSKKVKKESENKCEKREERKKWKKRVRKESEETKWEKSEKRKGGKKWEKIEKVKKESEKITVRKWWMNKLRK